MKKAEFLTTAQAALYLNISVATLKKFILQGKIRTFKTPGGHHRINKEDLLRGLYEYENTYSVEEKDALI